MTVTEAEAKQAAYAAHRAALREAWFAGTVLPMPPSEWFAHAWLWDVDQGSVDPIDQFDPVPNSQFLWAAD